MSRSTHDEHLIQIPEGTLVVLSGLPGSGKSYIRQHRTVNLELATWLSTDELRDEISPPKTILVEGRQRLARNEATNDAVFAIMRERVRAGLSLGRTVVVDATNASDSDRYGWIQIADGIGAPHLILILDTPLEVCLERALSRDHYVPEGYIRSMGRADDVARAPEARGASKSSANNQTKPKTETETETETRTEGLSEFSPIPPTTPFHAPLALNSDDRRPEQATSSTIEKGLTSIPDVATHAVVGSQHAPSAPNASPLRRTSIYTHQCISNNVKLVFTPRLLPSGAWDVVGDVHGLLDDLQQLLHKAGWPLENQQIRPHPEGRKLLFLGDLVDRGPQSIEVLRLVFRAVQDGLALCLKGNHEQKLLKFIDGVESQRLERWSSHATAETGMKLLKIEARERNELIRFMRFLPMYLLDPSSQTAFVHGDIHFFAPGVSTSDELTVGMSRWAKMDSDALYQEGVRRGYNRYTVVRGHFPETSAQSHIFALEREAYLQGELVLNHFDQAQKTLASFDAPAEERRTAFLSATLAHKCAFDFNTYSRKFDLIKGLEKLVEERWVVRSVDSTTLLRIYKYSKQTFWNNAWGHSPWILKARGIVLDPGGNIVSHPFDKVFNYQENDTGRDIEDDRPVIAVEKLNGFLGVISRHPVRSQDLLVTTQGSFAGEFVGYIESFLDPATRGRLLKYLSRHPVTLMFEVLHAEDPHIIEYPNSLLGLHLIGVRGKQPDDSAWLEASVDEAGLEMGLRRAAWRRTTFGALKTMARSARTEGWMVREDSDTQTHLLKIKTPYYLTTKFLGRLSSARIKYLFNNPNQFKQTVDEEFYPVVDQIVKTYTHAQFQGLEEDARVMQIRGLIERMQ